MTDEERKKLCDELSYAANRTDRHGYYGPLCRKAINEIELLAKELANANRLLEINRRRSLEKSGGLEIKQSKDMPDFTKIDWNTP